MINVNEKLLDVLDADQYYLVCKLMKYGKRSCPKNDVLVNSLGWGVNKLQKVKKQLVEHGILQIKPRFKILNGKRVKDSNEYLITSKLVSKYRGAELDKDDFHILQVHVNENQVDEYDVDDFHLHEFEVDENGVIIKVLRIVIIENNKVLRKESIAPTPKETKLSVAEKIKRSAAKLGVKNQDAKKEKSSAKKEKSETPEIAPIDLSDFPAIEDTNAERMPAKRLKWLKTGKGTNLEINLANFTKPAIWSEELTKKVFEYFEDRQERKGAGWASSGALAGMANQITIFLKETSESEMLETLTAAIIKGWSIPNPSWDRGTKMQSKDEKRNSNSAKSNSTNKAKSLSSAARAASFFANQHAESDDPKDNPWFDQSN